MAYALLHWGAHGEIAVPGRARRRRHDTRRRRRARGRLAVGLDGPRPRRRLRRGVRHVRQAAVADAARHGRHVATRRGPRRPRRGHHVLRRRRGPGAAHRDAVHPPLRDPLLRVGQRPERDGDGKRSTGDRELGSGLPLPGLQIVSPGSAWKLGVGFSWGIVATWASATTSDAGGTTSGGIMQTDGYVRADLSACTRLGDAITGFRRGHASQAWACLAVTPIIYERDWWSGASLGLRVQL
jgi:hypothetical protein